jgi:shikimate kinase
MKTTVVDNGIQPKPPLIVELVGLAATGKTTLFRALCQRDARILLSTDLQLRKIEHVPIFVNQVPSLLPVLFRRSRPDRWFTWSEIKAMAYLRAWPAVLRQLALNHSPLILLDQGPVFKLATLNAFGPESVKDRSFEQWWHNVFEQWAATLDIVIWLTAPAEILIQRIRARNKRHDIKDEPDREARQYLARYQASYEQILEKLTALGGTTLLKIDTSQRTIEQTLEEISLSVTSHLGEYQASSS